MEVNVSPFGKLSSVLLESYSILHRVPSCLARDWFPGRYRGFHLSDWGSNPTTVHQQSNVAEWTLEHNLTSVQLRHVEFST